MTAPSIRAAIELHRSGGYAEELALEVDTGDPKPAEIPIGVVHGARPGPTTLLVTGLHGTELMAQDLLRDVFRTSKPTAVSGTLIVVFCLDTLAASEGVPARNPRDGKNANRVWPGDAGGSYSERLAAAAFSELVSLSDTVIDLHGGEWNEEAVPFGIVPQGGGAEVDRRALDLARASGVPFIETADAAGAWLGSGTLIAESCRRGQCALAIAVGGGGRRTGRDRKAGAQILRNILAALGHIESSAVPAGTSTVLASSSTILAPASGVLVCRVRVGQTVSRGDVVADVESFGGRRIERVASDATGVVIVRSLARVVSAGGLIAKIGVS
jgi:uncharacterized protein